MATRSVFDACRTRRHGDQNAGCGGQRQRDTDDVDFAFLLMVRRSSRVDWRRGWQRGRPRPSAQSSSSARLRSSDRSSLAQRDRHCHRGCIEHAAMRTLRRLRGTTRFHRRPAVPATVDTARSVRSATGCAWLARSRSGTPRRRRPRRCRTRQGPCPSPQCLAVSHALAKRAARVAKNRRAPGTEF